VVLLCTGLRRTHKRHTRCRHTAAHGTFDGVGTAGAKCCAAIITGTIIGTRILSIIDERLLLFVVGICVITFTLFQTSSFKLQIGSRLVIPVGIIFGIASGVIGGISSMFGPMLIIYLVSVKDLDKNDFVSTISFLYICAVVPWAVLLFSVGLLRGSLLLGSSI